SALGLAAGAVYISGGSLLSSQASPVYVQGGIASITGGSIGTTQYGAAIEVHGGTLNISGGSPRGGKGGTQLLVAPSATVNIYGCGLGLSLPGGGVQAVTGTLADGTAINWAADGIPLGAQALQSGDLHNTPPAIACPPSVVVPMDASLGGASVTASAL